MSGQRELLLIFERISHITGFVIDPRSPAGTRDPCIHKQHMQLFWADSGIGRGRRYQAGVAGVNARYPRFCI